MSYSSLFWIDGIRCMLAGFLLLKVLHPKKAKVVDIEVDPHPKSAYTDKSFIIFILAMVIFGIIFLQLISTIHIFTRKALGFPNLRLAC